MNPTHSRLTAFLLVLWSLGPLRAGESKPLLPTAETPPQREARLAWWREARFGLFIHWGPSSISGKEISWARIGHPHDHRGLESVPPEEYDALYKRFNPVKFDADAWMRLAKDAGCKYVVFIAKHHDGFSMWPTKLRPEYSIAATPFQRDICKEIADAARTHDLKLGWYYSTRDWTHPDYLVGDNRAYDAFFRGQVRELLTQYGRADLLWFDHVAGNWRDYRFQELFEMLYRLQPGLLVNNRAAAFIRATDDQPSPELRDLVRGDFDTPEQRIGAFQNDRPWESCVTMTACADGGGWSYRPDGQTRGFAECLRMLVNCAAGDGNLLLNVGPLPSGEIAADQQAVLRQMGAWLARYGESIYATRGGPFRNGDWGGATHRDSTIYLHVLKWHADRLRLPPLKARVLRVTALTGGSAACHQSSAGVMLTLPPGQQDQTNTVLKLELDAPAAAEFRDGTPLEVPAPTTPASARGAGYPSRAPDLDALPGFQNPPPGYGEVPFWWWTGDPLDVERLLWQLDQLHRKGVSGVQVNYAHEDSPGWPTYAAEPPIFSEAWWRIWGRIADACRQRGMGIGLSTYTLDWPGGDNLFRRLFYSKSELNALRLEPLPRQRLNGGQSADVAVPGDLVAARAHPVERGQIRRGGIDLLSHVRDGRLAWTAPEGEWELWLIRAERQADTLNPLLAGIGETVIREFYQRFQDATPNRSSEGLNYFFNDELNVGAGARVWNADFADEFQRRKGYALFDVVPALWADLGFLTPKVRMDYADVRMALMEERYFRPIYEWHASRGLVFACDSGGRGLSPDEFGDYFRATRWYTAPGHDTPGGHADLIKGKVSSSIASLYGRPRVWLEGYHSLGWGATPERLMFATRENYLYGCTLLNLHGLYYTTHGSFWEWAPPCHHFRMPYWEHMGVFLKYFERLSYLLSQGAFVCDVAVLYPVAPFEAGLDGAKATQTAFDTGRALMAAGINFEFLDADSLARASIRNGQLAAADSSYRAVIFPAMDAVRWSSLQQAAAFAREGGLVLSVGTLPFASDRAGRDDSDLDALVAATFVDACRVAQPGDVPARILAAFTPDTRADKPVRSLHRKVGPREVYLVMDAPRGAAVEFRAKGQAELWDPWTGSTRPLRVLGETATGTRVEMPLEAYEATVVVFTPGRPHVNPAPRPDRAVQRLALEGDWEFELKPTMDNRYGDFRLPATDQLIGPEARSFRHALEQGDAAAWRAPAFDDRGWERVTYDFGPQFWLLGPLPAETDFDALDAALSKLTRVVSPETETPAGLAIRWRPYSFSWRQGLEGDPGHQGWHGLKKNVTDHFLCLGKRGDALNEYRYEPETKGGRYYIWTCATVDQPTTVRILASAREEGVKPHASEVLTPAAVFLNGQRVEDLRQPVSLRAGPNPILVRYDQAGRGYFVVKRDGPASTPAARTPLAMTWFDDPTVIRFDVHAGAAPAEWFRFVAPPGLRAIRVVAKGTLEAWVDGQPMRAAGPERFEAGETMARPSTVAVRVRPERGFSGAAMFPEPVRLECGPGVTSLGDWSKIGALECYSGGAWYRKTVSLAPDQVRGGLTLDLGKVIATAEVRVNGQVAGIRVAPPWRVDITAHIKAGENRLEVLVFNTLANHYLTIPTRYRGEPTSGLLGPVTLEVAPAEDGPP